MAQSPFKKWWKRNKDDLDCSEDTARKIWVAASRRMDRQKDDVSETEIDHMLRDFSFRN